MDISAVFVALLWICAFGIVFYVLWWGIGKLGLGEPWNKIAIGLMVLLTIIAVIWILQGLMPTMRPLMR